MEDEQTNNQITRESAVAGRSSNNEASASAVRQSITDRQNGLRAIAESSADPAVDGNPAAGNPMGAAVRLTGALPAGEQSVGAETNESLANRITSDEGPAGSGSAVMGSADSSQTEGAPAEDGPSAIGPIGAAPQWLDFYRAIRHAVTDMRSGK